MKKVEGEETMNKKCEHNYEIWLCLKVEILTSFSHNFPYTHAGNRVKQTVDVVWKVDMNIFFAILLVDF